MGLFAKVSIDLGGSERRGSTYDRQWRRCVGFYFRRGERSGCHNSLTVGLIDARYGEHFNPKFWNFWRHEHAPLQLLGGKMKSPYFNRDFLVDAGSQYLALPYRAPLLKCQTLIDALMAAEVFAFGQLVREREPFLMRHVLSPYIDINPPSAVLGYFIGNILIAIFLGVPAAIIAWVAGVIFPGQAAFWVIVAAIGLWALLFAFSTILLPFQIWSGWTRRRNSRAMSEAAVKAYAELAPGVVSTIRVREVAAAAADKGVVWPDPRVRSTGRQHQTFVWPPVNPLHEATRRRRT